MERVSTEFVIGDNREKTVFLFSDGRINMQTITTNLLTEVRNTNVEDISVDRLELEVKAQIEELAEQFCNKADELKNFVKNVRKTLDK